VSSAPPNERQRLGVYVDDVYRVREEAEGRTISVDRAFLLFVCEVGLYFDRLVLFGRTLRTNELSDYVLPASVELAELPHYSKLSLIREVVRASLGTFTGMWRGLRRVDKVWVLGPHPFSLILIALAIIQRKSLVLGVRQNTLAYYRARLPSNAWRPILGGIWLIDVAYRLLARVIPTTVVGREIARHYSAGHSVLTMTASLVRAEEIADAPPIRTWENQITLLSVGRVEPEKNPLLLVEALARLNGQFPDRFRVIWLGRGELEADVRRRAEELRVSDAFVLRGYVPFGDELFRLYRDAHVFVHVSLTEGLPQVIVEALAAGTPVVATDVGSVADALDGGRAGLLVPPGDVDALVAAIRRIVTDAHLRNRLVARGLELARNRTLEAQAERVARFIAGDASLRADPGSVA
jgi:glycosyltransferase involved in cell wall biosynthesis